MSSCAQPGRSNNEQEQTRREFGATVLPRCRLRAARAVRLAAEKNYDAGSSDTKSARQTVPHSGPVRSMACLAGSAEGLFPDAEREGRHQRRKIHVLLTMDDAYSRRNASRRRGRLSSRGSAGAVRLGSAPRADCVTISELKGVPQLLLNTGASKWNDRRTTNGPCGLPLYPTRRDSRQARRRHQAECEVGILYQNDDFGRDISRPLQKVLAMPAARQVT